MGEGDGRLPLPGVRVGQAVEEGVLPCGAQDPPGEEGPGGPVGIPAHPRQYFGAGRTEGVIAVPGTAGRVLGQGAADVVRVAAEAVSLGTGEGGPPYGRGGDVGVRRAGVRRGREGTSERGLEDALGDKRVEEGRAVRRNRT